MSKKLTVGNDNVTSLYVGSQKVKKIYAGSELVYESTPPPAPPTPSKGLVVEMNLDGTWKKYKLLKNIQNDEWLVTALFACDTVSVLQNNWNGTPRPQKDALETWYSSLNSTAISAIKQQTAIQYASVLSNTHDRPYKFTNANNSSYSITLGTTGNSYTLYVRPLLLEEVFEYLGITPNNTTPYTSNDIKPIFEENSTPLVSNVCLFEMVLMYTYAFEITGNFDIDITKSSTTLNIVPSFIIDLSQISYR